MNENKLFRIKPVFTLSKNLLVNLPISLLIGLIVASQGLAIYGAIVKPATSNLSNTIFLYLIVLMIITILSLLFNFINEKFNYNATEYLVYSDRIEFQEGFINSQFTVLKLSNVQEIHIRKSFLQKLYGLGTIRFVTSANALFSNSGINSTGIEFIDITNADTIYKKIKDLLDTSRN